MSGIVCRKTNWMWTFRTLLRIRIQYLPVFARSGAMDDYSGSLIEVPKLFFGIFPAPMPPCEEFESGWNWGKVLLHHVLPESFWFSHLYSPALQLLYPVLDNPNYIRKWKFGWRVMTSNAADSASAQLVTVNGRCWARLAEVHGMNAMPLAQSIEISWKYVPIYYGMYIFWICNIESLHTSYVFYIYK